MISIDTKDKDLVKEVKQTIKELQDAHKGNLKYRPYAQDISYAMKARNDRHHLTTTEVQQILWDNNIKIKQPIDPVNDPKSEKLVPTKGK